MSVRQLSVPGRRGSISGIDCRRSALSARFPLEYSQIDPATFRNGNTFLKQQESLQALSRCVSSIADSALGIHNTMPRNAGIFRQPAKDRAYLPRIRRSPGKRRNFLTGYAVLLALLAIGGVVLSLLGYALGPRLSTLFMWGWILYSWIANAVASMK